MLIFDSRKGKFGTQKLRQWGSTSSVRSAVFRNAAAMGVDPESIGSLVPLWEGVGVPRDIILDTELTPSATVTTWDNNGLALGSSGVSYTSNKYNSRTVGVGQYTILVTDFTITQAYLRGLWSSNNYDFALAINTSNYCYIYDSGYKTTSSAALEINKQYDIASVRYSTAASDSTYYINGSSAGNYTHSDTVPATTTFTWLRDRVSGGYGCEYSNIGLLSFFYSALSTQQIAQLHESPYLLLQPNPTPLIFDFGAAPSGWDHKIYGLSVSKIYGVSDPTKVIGV